MPMITVAVTIRLILYIIANLTSIPSLWVLWHDKLLHRNFRSILIIIVISGYIISISAYLQIAVLLNTDIATENAYIHIARKLFYLGSAEFSYANLCMTIERCLAVHSVATYEKYSSSKVAIFVTCVIVVLPPIVINVIVERIWSDQLVSFLSFFVFSFASVVMSMYIRCYKSSRVGDVNTSLGSRFQNQENCKTMVIYLTFTMTEVFSCIVLIILINVMHQRNEDFTFERNSFMDDVMYMVSSYRTICVHFILIYYWYKNRRSTGVKTILISQNTEAHFNAMKRLW